MKKDAFIRVKDVPVGEIFVVRDVLDGEVRNTFYLRSDKQNPTHPANVGMGRIGLCQADTSGELRFERFTSPPCFDPGEMTGLQPCYLESDFPDALAWVRELIKTGGFAA